MLCANYYTSVIKNLLPPTAGPPPLPSFSVCKLAKTKREIQEGMSLPACAICVCAKAAGRCRGLCGARPGSGSGRSALARWCSFIPDTRLWWLQFGRGLSGSRSVSTKQPAPLQPGLFCPCQGFCWHCHQLSPLVGACNCLKMPRLLLVGVLRCPWRQQGAEGLVQREELHLSANHPYPPPWDDAAVMC